MSREKQIEEMAKVIEETNCGYGVDGCHCCEFDVTKDVSCADRRIAIALYKAGYRKASEVAREIFEEIEKIIDKHYNRHIFGVEDLSDVEQEAVMNFSGDVTYDIAELKKKYTEEGK